MGKQLGQISLEFVFLVALAFTIMVVFMASTRSEFDWVRTEQERSLVKDVSVTVQHELILASGIEDGYLREFNLPEELDDSIVYNISIISNSLITTTENYEYVLNVPSTNGSLVKGTNIINKTGGVIYLN